MCLNRISFALKEYKGEFVGTGYKLMEKEYLPKMRVWYKASAKHSDKAKPPQLNCEKTTDKYRAGFHVFLTKEDALQYQPTSSRYHLYEVKFKVITGFGKNSKYGIYKDSEYAEADCVIAEHLKYEKDLGEQRLVKKELGLK